VAPVPLPQGLSLVHITHYFSAYWQARLGVTASLPVPADFPVTFPREAVLARLSGELAGNDEAPFGLIMTDYFGGYGDQWAIAVSPALPTPLVTGSVNEVLRALGVVAVAGKDEFDSVGLGEHSETPDYLDRYQDLCAEIGA